MTSEPSSSDSSAPRETDATIIDRICDAFESACRNGDDPHIGDFLTSADEALQPELFKELLLSEFDFRSGHGETIDLREYVDRFPQYRDQVLSAIAEFSPSGHHVRRSGPTDSSAWGASASLADNADVRECGSYQLLHEIARGGMGVVFKAYDTKLQRTVALKMILDRNLASQEAVQRFHAEAETAAGLDHPGIVPVYDVGTHEGHHYYAMGYIEGPTLAEELKRREFSVDESVQLVLQLASAVACAHEHGVVHRDLKPENILLSEGNQPHITDFGLAKRTDRPSVLTMDGQILGTPGYMAPEQAAGDIAHAGPAADIYALGAILYHFLTGHPPFRISLEAIVNILEQDPVPPRVLNRRIPRDLDVICMKCLNKRPWERYETAQQLADDLQSYLDHELIQARPASLRRRILRWARHRPRLATVLTAMTAFYIYHLICLVPGDGDSGGWFHWVATGTVLIVCAYAWFYQSALLRPNATPLILYSWVATDILAFTLFLMFAADGIDSPLIALYPCMVAGAALSFNRHMVWLITGVSVLSYCIVVLHSPWHYVTSKLPPPDLRQTIPMAISMVVIGLVQYYVLRCTRFQKDPLSRSTR